jgi:hypothetical protein
LWQALRRIIGYSLGEFEKLAEKHGIIAIKNFLAYWNLQTKWKGTGESKKAASHGK